LERAGALMATVGERLELEVTDLARDGRGIGRRDAEVVFVAGGLPGDRLAVRIAARHRHHLVGELLQVLTPSPSRRRPPCILADHCGGCTLQPLEDRAQQRWKENLVRESLRRLGGLDDPPLRPLVPAPDGLGYRNRAVIPLERSGDGRLRAGYYRRGTHRIVNMNRCPVLDPRIDGLIAPLKADLEASGWPIDRHGDAPGGGLRHLALRLGVRTGEVLLTLIATHDRLPDLEELARHWRHEFPDLVGVCLNLQPLATNILMGADTRVVAGRGWLIERFAGLDFRIAADTFFQVHTTQAEAVVALLLEGLGPPAGTLIDAFCGIGTYSLPLAAAGWRVVGIEQHPPAVDLAAVNAAANGLAERATFETAAVAAVLAERLVGVEALFLDPPRKGLEEATLEAIRSRPPRRLLYLSCDPATLARDLNRLLASGPYRLLWAQPIDFFPNTSHIETLAVLERR
jgi:23S rRNA (uracil1939-C5)-methyltransferase